MQTLDFQPQNCKFLEVGCDSAFIPCIHSLWHIQIISVLSESLHGGGEWGEGQANNESKNPSILKTQTRCLSIKF